MIIKDFQQAVLSWFAVYGRRHLPWQQQVNPYRVWLSEIMLQQTQVSTVIAYFEKFVRQFPTIEQLAAADEETVLYLWSGLGYYARARNLHRTAKIITTQFAGRFPQSLLALQQLPGIGRSTAGAILAMAMHQPAAILDGNVKRLLARLFLLHPWQSLPILWTWAEKLIPPTHSAAYTQALMDLGALVCTRTKPKCGICPLTRWCLAYQQQRQVEFPGSPPKKNLPTKKTQLLLLNDKYGRLCMEKRLASGIWGGLWSLPAYDATDTLENYCVQRLGCDIALTYRLPNFQHTFTHFHLEITPLVITVRCLTCTPVAPYRWLTQAEQQKLGMPAPIRRLVQENT